MEKEGIKPAELGHGTLVIHDGEGIVLRADRMAEWPSNHHWVVLDRDMFSKLVKYATSIGWMDQ